MITVHIVDRYTDKPLSGRTAEDYSEAILIRQRLIEAISRQGLQGRYTARVFVA